MSKKYICSVCGFDDLEESPYEKNDLPSYEICPCCGFEPGFNSGQNKEETYKIYRDQWVQSGAQWFIADKKPKHWSLNKQLGNLKYI